MKNCTNTSGRARKCEGVHNNKHKKCAVQIQNSCRKCRDIITTCTKEYKKTATLRKCEGNKHKRIQEGAPRSDTETVALGSRGVITTSTKRIQEAAREGVHNNKHSHSDTETVALGI